MEVLLIEPNYKNKYPPIPLMKLSTYYKNLGYNVRFFKGDIKELLKENKKYDIVCITTLFTFYYNITVETINLAKNLCKTLEGVKVGGILASILPKELEKDTAIKPIIGREKVIDNLPLDYSILDDIDYKYPDTDSYYFYTSRGCINKCKFCIVPKIEPIFEPFIPITEEIKEKRYLKLLDNNVLASPYFNDIVDNIKQVGFSKDSYVIRNGRKLKRYVDFNQGIDSRLITEENMKKLAELPVRPVRIAFDHWSMKDIYEKALIIAIKAGHNYFSNYLLYNFEDKPEELYLRVKLNIDIAEKYNVNIYSFPMRYHPITDLNFCKGRKYIGKYWNKKFIRAIQAILHATLGKFGGHKSFFEFSCGRDVEEFYKILYMPEYMIKYRKRFSGEIKNWWKDFNDLSDDEKTIAKQIIENCVFKDIKIENKRILKVLDYYKIKKGLV